MNKLSGALNQILMVNAALALCYFTACNPSETKTTKADSELNWSNSSVSDSSQTGNQSDFLVTKPLPEIASKERNTAYPEVFEQAFLTENTIGLSQQVLGKLKIEGGKILAGDPASMATLQPFAQDVPNGSFPVEIAMAPVGDYQGVHFARVRFKNSTVKEWEFARFSDQKSLKIEDTTMYCFKTESGMAVVLCPAAIKTFENSNPGQLWHHIFVEKAEKNNHTGFLYSIKNQNLMTCNTGTGPGCYSVYFGYNQDKEICQMLLDFALIEWWK